MLKRVSPRWRTPVPAIWTTAALALASTLYAPAYSTLTTACVIFLYLSYVMPTLVGLRAFGRTWTRFGPFHLGGPLYKSLGVVSVLGAALLVWIGVQPPNEKALTVVLAMAGPAARRLVAGRPPPLPRPARHEDRLTDPRNPPPEPRPGATRSRAAGSGARAGPGPPGPRAPTRARRSPAACA